MFKLTIRLFFYIFVFVCSVYLGVYASSSAEDNHNSGKRSYIRGDYFSAIDFYRKSLNENPYFKDALVSMGEVFYSLGNYDNAIKYFRSAEDKFSSDVGIKLWLARVQLARGRFEASESYLLKALKLSPRNYNAYLLYGDLFVKRSDFRRSIDYYKEAILVDGANDRAYLKLGISYFVWGKFADALSYFEKAYNLNDRNPNTSFYLAKYFEKMGNYGLSEEYLRMSLLLRPSYLPAMRLFYKVLFKLEKWDESKVVLEKLLSIDKFGRDGGEFSNTVKDISNYHYDLGLVYEKLGNPSKSLSILLDGIEYDRGNQALRYRAEEVFRKYYWTDKDVMDLGSSLSEYWHKKGNNYLSQGLNRLASFSFRRGIRLSPKDIPLRLSLAQMYRLGGYLDAYSRELNLVQSLISKDSKDAVEIKDELTFTSYALERSLSKREGIVQYDEPSPSPKVGLLPFDLDNDFAFHSGIEDIYRDLFYTALKMKDRLNVVLIEGGDNKDRRLLSEGTDFIIKGRLREHRGGIEVSLDVFNSRDGELYKTFNLFQRGNDSFVISVLHLSDELEKVFPIFANIIRKNHKEVFLNLGFRHNYKVGDEFYVIEKGNFSDLLKDNALHRLVSNKSNLKHKLLSFRRDSRFGLDRVKIVSIDENISKAELITSDFFDEVNIGDYLIYVPN